MRVLLYFLEWIIFIWARFKGIRDDSFRGRDLWEMIKVLEVDHPFWGWGARRQIGSGI
jgi:hypothetical protein